MTALMVYALVAYFIGVIIKRFVNPEVGDTIAVVAACLFVFFWLIGIFR